MASKADISAGKAFVRLFLKNDFSRQLAGALKAGGAKLQGWGRSTMMAGAGMTAAGTAILAPIAAAVQSFADQGDQLDKMAKRTGMAGGALAELSFAAEQSGTDLGVFEKATKRMQGNLTDAKLGLTTATDGLDMVRLSVEQLEALSPEDQFQAIADGVAAIEDPSKKSAAAQKLFGKSGVMLIPMLDDLRALRQEARDLGIIPAQEEIDNAAKVTDAINRVKRSVKAAFFNIGASLAKPALKFLAVIKGIAKSIGEFVKGKGAILATLAAIGAGLVLAGTALTAFGVTLFAAGMALSALGAAVGVLLSPVGLIVAALVGGAAAWLKFSDSGKRALSSLGPIVETLKAAFGGITDALVSGNWELAGKIAMTGLKLAILQGLSAIQQAFPETFQTVLRVIGRIGDGIVMVWSKVTGFLTGIWNSWGKHTVQAVMDVAAKFVDIWQGAVEGLANWMLKQSAQGGPMGKLMSKILGVDMAEVQKERDRMNRELKLGPEDVLGETRKAVKDYVDNMGLPELEAGTGTVSEGLEDFLGKLTSGMAVEDLAKELAALRSQAATEAAAAGGGSKPPADGGAGGGPLLAGASRGAVLTATYSAAAAQISGYQPGGGPEERMAAGIGGINENTKQMLVKTGELLGQGANQLVMFQQFLAGWKVS